MDESSGCKYITNERQYVRESSANWRGRRSDDGLWREPVRHSFRALRCKYMYAYIYMYADTCEIHRPPPPPLRVHTQTVFRPFNRPTSQYARFLSTPVSFDLLLFCSDTAAISLPSAYIPSGSSATRQLFTLSFDLAPVFINEEAFNYQKYIFGYLTVAIMPDTDLSDSYCTQ